MTEDERRERDVADMYKLNSWAKLTMLQKTIRVVLIVAFLLWGLIYVADIFNYVSIPNQILNISLDIIASAIWLNLLIQILVQRKRLKKNTINAEAVFIKAKNKHPDEIVNIIQKFSDYQLLDIYLQYINRVDEEILRSLYVEMQNRGLFDSGDEQDKVTQYVLKAKSHDSVETFVYDKFIFKKKSLYDDGLLVKIASINRIEQSRARSQLLTRVDVIKVHYDDAGEEKEFNIEPDSMSKWLSTLDSMGLKKW